MATRRRNAVSTPSASPYTCGISTNDAGDMLLVALTTSNNVTANTPTDTKGNTYTKLIGPVGNTSSGFVTCWLASNIPASASTNTVSSSMSSSPGTGEMIVAEYQPAANTTPSLEASGANSGVNSGTSPLTGNFSSSQSNDLMFCYCGTSATRTFTAGATGTPGNWSKLPAPSPPDSFTGVEDSLTNSSSATNTGRWTLNSSTNWTVIAVAIKEVASGNLSGTIAGSATQTGALTGDGALSGSITGAASSTAALTGAGDLAGSASGSSTVSGTGVSLGLVTGTIAGTSTVSAALLGDGVLIASVAGIASQTATLLGDGVLAGSSAGIASSTAALAGTGELAGTSSGSAAVSATITGTGGGPNGTADGISTASGTLIATGELAGSSPGIAAATAVLIGTIQIAGASSGISSSTGLLTGFGSLDGNSTGSSTAQLSIGLSGTASGLAVVNGILIATGLLSGLANGAGLASGIGTETRADIITVASADGQLVLREALIKLWDLRRW